jgi:hypothetical protein
MKGVLANAEEFRRATPERVPWHLATPALKKSLRPQERLLAFEVFLPHYSLWVSRRLGVGPSSRRPRAS